MYKRQATDNSCSDFYLNKDPECISATPNLGISTLEVLWEATEGTIDNRIPPVVGDIDGDCIPDIVSFDEGELNIYDGVTGRRKTTFAVATDNRNVWGSLAIADLDNDGNGEIVLQEGLAITAYHHDGSQMFKADSLLNKESAMLAFADFNEDGLPEIYAEDLVINGQTGEYIARGGVRKGTVNSHNANTIAGDFLPDGFCASCDGLELIAGGIVYSVDEVNDTMYVCLLYTSPSPRDA